MTVLDAKDKALLRLTSRLEDHYLAQISANTGGPNEKKRAMDLHQLSQYIQIAVLNDQYELISPPPPVVASMSLFPPMPEEGDLLEKRRKQLDRELLSEES